jgi:hypothetical protein
VGLAVPTTADFIEPMLLLPTTSQPEGGTWSLANAKSTPSGRIATYRPNTRSAPYTSDESIPEMNKIPIAGINL